MSGPLPDPEREWRPRPRPESDPRALAEARVGPSFESVRLLPGGQANLNLLLDGERVLRIYRRDPDAVEKERRLVERGWETFRVPGVLDGGPDFLLLERIGLSRLRDSADHGEKVGLAAAEIHGIRFESAGFLDADLEVVDPLPEARSHLTATLHALGEPWTAHTDWLSALAGGIEEEIRSGAAVLNHGDFKASNLFADSDDRPVVLDWEFAFSGPALLDLGQLFRWGPSREFRDGFVRGYEGGQHTLPDDWRERAEVLDLVNLLGLARGAGSDEARVRDLRRRIERSVKWR